MLRRGKDGELYRNFFHRDHVVKRLLLIQEKPDISSQKERVFLKKDQESTLIEIIPLISTSVTEGQYPALLHPESFQGAQLGVTAMTAGWRATTPFVYCGNVLPSRTYTELSVLVSQRACSALTMLLHNLLQWQLLLVYLISPIPQTSYIPPLCVPSSRGRFVLFIFISQTQCVKHVDEQNVQCLNKEINYLSI